MIIKLNLKDFKQPWFLLKDNMVNKVEDIIKPDHLGFYCVTKDDGVLIKRFKTKSGYSYQLYNKSLKVLTLSEDELINYLKSKDIDYGGLNV